MNQRDIYQEITDRITSELENGTVPWHRPWNTPEGMPRNLNGRPYRGINILLLLLQGHSDPRWGTYKMIASHGGQVRKGEKATRVILWKPIKSKTEKNDDGTPKMFLLLRDYAVFNAEQCDGLPEIPVDVNPLSPVDAAEQIFADMDDAPEREHHPSRAAYDIKRDVILMPGIEQFDDEPSYYTTLFHELTHATGHEKRVGGLEPSTFGSDPYAKEELVAEMGAAFLLATAGLEPRFEANASYIANWLTALKNDNRLVIQAAAQAQRRCDHVLGVKFETPAEDQPAGAVAA